MDSHKRTKSSAVKSMLQRVSSRTDVPQSDPPQTDTSSTSLKPPTAESPTASSAASINSQTAPSQPSSLGPKRHRPHLSTTMSATNTQDLHLPTSPAATDASPASPATKGATIEQSVKLFRVFEALRSGDTAAISKAIKEESGAASDEPRPSTSSLNGTGAKLEGTSVLHLAIQCADMPVIEYILSNVTPDGEGGLDINARDRDGNTALHIASMLGRGSVVKLLLEQRSLNDSATNYTGQTALDMARTPEIHQQLQLARSIFVESAVRKIQGLIAELDYDGLEKLLADSRIRSNVDVNGPELATEPTTVESGGTLLHEATRKKDTKLIQLLLLNGADPFRRDRKGRLPQDLTKDDRLRNILKRSPAAAAAQRAIQEKTILGANASSPAGAAPGEGALGNKEAREMKGYLKKWTNYTSGYKLRWFVLEDGVLSYYKHQDDAGSACRGAINMRIAKLQMDPQDKLRFEIHGKSSVKYHLKANHQVECKRWFWALNNAIQWSKDEAKEEEKRQQHETQAMHARVEQVSKSATDTPADSDSRSVGSSKGGRGLVPGTALGVPMTSTQAGSTVGEDDFGGSTYESSVGANHEMARYVSQVGTATIEGDIDEDEEYGDDASSHEAQPASKDAFNITAQSAKIQLDLLQQVSAAMAEEKRKNPNLTVSDPVSQKAFESYQAAIGNLKNLIGDLLRISRDRDAYWQYRLDREQNVRRMWEESMARVAKEQEELEASLGESEEKRKRTKRALREALEGMSSGHMGAESRTLDSSANLSAGTADLNLDKARLLSPQPPTATTDGVRRKSTIADIRSELEEDSDDDEEFFDAVGAGEVEVLDMPPSSPPPPTYEEAPATKAVSGIADGKQPPITESFQGYEDPPRKRLRMDADNRPKISLWGILKSMIGKDMTKMTLPVSFNEPTSLLYRVAEDMEYTDLLDTAAERADSAERMVYVAAFAASEYASTIGRVAKPFNPLLGETYEYCRPDKGYRFFCEQVSHHPPIGAAWAESKNWDYYGESAVKSKFYGKSFDINPLGTWYLTLRPTAGGKEELYTWKKVTSSVIGIITGSPTVDNYGPMEVKNHTTGETCILDFQARGWKASSAYKVVGKVMGADGRTRWSMGGKWDSKLYARLTPGYEADVSTGPAAGKPKEDQAFLVWEAHTRPTPQLPFNLTSFAVTLNALPDNLKPILPPTDSRFRPDQRAMEDGEYDHAAVEKNRVEEKQRGKRRDREARGEEYEPKWFSKQRHPITGEEYWDFNHEYWVERNRGNWSRCEEIF